MAADSIAVLDFAQNGLQTLNARALAIAERIEADADLLQCKVYRGPCGERLIDLGAEVAGGFEAGRRMAEACLGGLGSVHILPVPGLNCWALGVSVHVSDVRLACLASQYAGWKLEDEKAGYFALGSGPARAQARIEDLFEHINYSEHSSRCLITVESGTPPPPVVVRRIAMACGIAPERLTVMFAPTGCSAGSVQIAARVIEVSLHKAHGLKFPLHQIADAWGCAPVAPVSRDPLTAMGRTNDAIIYGGAIHFNVRCSDPEARQLAANLSSSSSPSYGAMFSEMLSSAGGDFYKLDGSIFSPAKITITNILTGNTCSAGKFNSRLLRKSFGI